MKVVYVTSESYIDHSYTIVQELRKHLEDFTVYIQGKRKTDEIETWCNKLNAEFIQRKRFRNPFSIFSELAFISKIKKQNPDFVWFNTISVYQMFFVKLMIKKFLVVVHDVELHPGSAGHGTLAVRMTFKLAKKNICVVSKTQSALFKKLYDIEPRIFQLPIINYYRESAVKDITMTPAVKPRFLFFGTIEQYKGIETLLDAAEILEQQGVDFVLNICGRINYNKEALRVKIASLKNVVLNDNFIDCRNIHALYQQNDVIVLPYKQVTQCGPLLIGFDEVVPSICNDLEGFREYVSDGVTGIMFNNTKESLALKMKLFIENPELKQKIKENIKKQTYDKFLMSALTRSYIENFNDIINS